MDKAVRDPSSAVYVGALLDDGVLHLVVSGCVVSDTRVGFNEGFFIVGWTCSRFDYLFVNS